MPREITVKTVKTKGLKIIDEPNFYSILIEPEEDETAAMVDVPIKLGDVDCLFDDVSATQAISISSSESDFAVNASKNTSDQDSCRVHTRKRKYPRTKKRRVKRRLKNTRNAKKTP